PGDVGAAEVQAAAAEQLLRRRPLGPAAGGGDGRPRATPRRRRLLRRRPPAGGGRAAARPGRRPRGRRRPEAQRRVRDGRLPVRRRRKGEAVSDAADRPETAALASRQRVALLVGATALLLCTGYAAAGAALPWPAAESFFRAYLTAFTFWLGVSLGCMALLMI